MIVDLIKRSFFDNSYQMETSYTRLVPNVGTIDGVLSRGSSSYEPFDFVEYSSQFKSSDFDITSLLNVGAYDMLKPTYISTISSMDFADKFQDIPSPESKSK